MVAALVAEVVLTCFFLLVILGATDRRAPLGFAPIAIGLCLTLIHLISIPVTNTSVNPARSTGPAIFVGGWALEQLWLFWLAPLVGARTRRHHLPADCSRQGLAGAPLAALLCPRASTLSCWTVTFSSSSVLPACEVTFTL